MRHVWIPRVDNQADDLCNEILDEMEGGQSKALHVTQIEFGGS